MRKFSILAVIVIVLLAIGSAQNMWAKDSFKFPSRISFKLYKNGSFVGECQLLYREKTDKKGISSLKLTNFQALGISSRESLITYMFSKNFSIYADFVKKGAKVVSEFRLKEETGFDGKKGEVFVHKEFKTDDDEIKTEIPTQYPVLDLLSTFLISSERVASGELKKKKKEPFNLLFGRSTKIVAMVHIGTEKEPYKGKTVDTEVLSITIRSVEMFRLKIFKDKDGYCFPLSITLSDFTDNKEGTFEMRTARVAKK